MSVSDAVEVQPRDFRPRTYRQFLVLNIALRFGDLANLPRYLDVCYHPKKDLLDAARRAEQESLNNGSPAPAPFFSILTARERREDS